MMLYIETKTHHIIIFTSIFECLLMLVINIYLILQAYNYMFMQSIQNALHEMIKKKNPY